jgi:D-3-phosphoglycerate dehydrogenase / 2-oxoglutarate reductase
MHILVPDNLHKDGLALLNDVEGITVHAPGKMSRDDVKAVLGEADAMIVRSGTKADAELLELATKLKVIVRAGVGVDNIDLDAATAKNIVVMNAPQGNTIATAEHTLALMLSLARHIPQAQQSMIEGRWDRKQYMGTELRGKVLGLVGFGRVGRAVAQRARAFEMMVIAHDPFVPAEVGAEHAVELVELDDLFARADYISLHAVVTDDTREFINTANIAKMKDGVRIINAARGALIHDADLAKAIQSGKVAGAALDVYVKEPPEASHPLVGLSGVIDTPHLGASTVEAQTAVAVEAAEKVLNALQQQEYRDVVNPAVLDQLS